jgi:hypothetical protein
MFAAGVYKSSNLEYNECITGIRSTILMKAFRKYLVYVYVPIMEKTFRSGSRENCVAQRSIYIILSGNEETRRYIHQVRSALTHLLFC